MVHTSGASSTIALLLCLASASALSGGDGTFPERVALVIGGGPAGLCTALGLSDLCSVVHVVEKRQSFGPRGSAFVLKPNGRRALAELDPDLASEMDGIGSSLDVPGVPGLLMPWWYMRDAILARVRRCPNVEIHMGEALVDIVDDEIEGGGTTVTFESGLRLRGDFLVGADGVHSTVREKLGLPPGIATGSTSFRGHIQIDEQSSASLQQLLKRGKVPHPQVLFGNTFFTSFCYHPKIRGLVSWVVSTKERIPLDGSVTPLMLIGDYITRNRQGDPDGEYDKDWDVIREILESSNAESLVPFPPAEIIDLSDEALSDLGGGWGGRGRVTLLGDAAHAMNPTDGQGGSQAFEDVVVLRRTLIRCDSGDLRSVERALREFEASRLPRVKRIYEDQSERLKKRYRNEKEEPYTEEYREWLEAGV